jgi:acyl-CoA thioesterase-1
VACGGGTKEKKPEGEAINSEVTSATESTTKTKKILFFGNSLTAGMGLEPEMAFPGVIQGFIDSLHLNYTVINAGLSGETTASGENRVSWMLNQKIDIFVLELGANDGLRGIPLEETRENLQAIIDAVLATNPDTHIILAGMQIPPNMGPAYTTDFKRIFPELAKKNNTALIPFLLENVAGNPDLNQEDGIHPTEEGQKIVAKNVWEILEPLVN